MVKLFATVLLLAVLVGTAYAQAFVQAHTAGYDCGSATDCDMLLDNPVASGDTIIVPVRIGSLTATVTVTDAQGDTFVADRSQQQTGDGHTGYIYRAFNAIGGTTTVHVHTSATVTIRGCPAEYGGADTLDQVNSSSGLGAAADSGNITTTHASELVIGAMTLSVATTVTVGGGFTSRCNLTGRVVLADRILSSTQTLSSSFTWTGSYQWAALITSYYASTGGGGTAQQTHGGLLGILP